MFRQHAAGARLCEVFGAVGAMICDCCGGSRRQFVHSPVDAGCCSCLGVDELLLERLRASESSIRWHSAFRCNALTWLTSHARFIAGRQVWCRADEQAADCDAGRRSSF